MAVEARWALTPEYLRRFHRDWLRHAGFGARWVLPLGLAAIVCGLLLYALALAVGHDSYWPALGLAGAGLFQTLRYRRETRQWRQAMRQGLARAGANILVFTEAGIDIGDPESRSHVGWQACRQIIPGDHGLLLCLERGHTLYVPDSALSPRYGRAAILALFRKAAQR